MLQRTAVLLATDGPPFTPRANRLKDGLKRTAFWPAISPLTCAFKVHNTYLKPDVFTDPVEEYWAMRRHAGLWDVTGEEVVEIAGPDAMALVARCVPRRLEKLADGMGMFAFLTWPHGGVVEDGVLTRFHERRLWWVGGPGPAEMWLCAQAAGLDVEVRSCLDDIHLCAVQGPKARDILQAAAESDLSALPRFGMAETRLFGIDTVVTRTGFTAELGYDIHIHVDRALEVFEGLREAGRPFGLTLAGSQAMNLRRVEAGILNIGAEIDHTTTPLELGWERMIDWQRDFVGREALVAQRRRDVRRRIAGLLLEGGACCRAGDTVFHRGSPAGLVTSAVEGPSVKAGIALAMLATPAWHEGSALQVGENGLAARSVPLPFFDPERRLARA